MSDLISRTQAIDAVHKAGITEYDETLAIEEIERVPSAQPEVLACGEGVLNAQPEWNNHTVACMIAELFDDDCACNYNGIDEWLPEKCEVIDACPNPVGVACWEQFLKHRAERRTDAD